MWQSIKALLARLWATAHTDEPQVTRAQGETEQIAPPAEPEKPKDDRPWLTIMRRYIGKREDDPDFERELTPWWKKLYNRTIDGIRGNAKAWCGLMAGFVLFGAGYAVPRHGEMAANWRKDPNFVYLDYRKVGIPAGAFVGINHSGRCDGASGNHITLANGDCSPQDLAKPGAMFDGVGGNQNNRVGVNAYGVKEICSVGWPAKAPLPNPVTASSGCGGGREGSTR